AEVRVVTVLHGGSPGATDMPVSDAARTFGRDRRRDRSLGGPHSRGCQTAPESVAAGEPDEARTGERSGRNIARTAAPPPDTVPRRRVRTSEPSKVAVGNDGLRRRPESRSARTEPLRSSPQENAAMEDSLARSVGTLAAALVYLAPAAAQPQFEPRMKRHLPWDVAMTYAVALGDVDGDGDLDRVTTSFFDTYGPSDGWITLALNDGSGVFRDVTTARMPTFDMSARAVALADVDGDGDLDIIAPESGRAHV